MSYEFFRKLPTPLEIKTMYPVSDEVAKQKKLNKLQAERDDYRKQVVADFQKT